MWKLTVKGPLVCKLPSNHLTFQGRLAVAHSPSILTSFKKIEMITARVNLLLFSKFSSKAISIVCIHFNFSEWMCSWRLRHCFFLFDVSRGELVTCKSLWRHTGKGENQRKFVFSTSRGRGVLREKSGGGVRTASQNPYPVYDQILQFSIFCLGPDPSSLVQTNVKGTVIDSWRAFVDRCHQ